MRIKSIHVRDFKRFTDLQVVSVPETAALVVLLGPNGSGKTSLFEALNFWQSSVRGHEFRPEYHWKAGSHITGAWNELQERIDVEFHGRDITRSNQHLNTNIVKKALYFRSAYRHEAELSAQSSYSLSEMIEDQGRPSLLIRQESRVSDNYRRLVAEAINELFAASDDSQPIREVRDRLIGHINRSMQHLFGDLDLSGLGRPMAGGTFLFNKGVSKNFDYRNLSGGEKAAFDLLLDFVVKTQVFDDTVFCIDEPEIHMHTRLQSRLLDEMCNIMPRDCQLWIATHSIGMLRRAMELHRDNPEMVAFLDFEGVDFDRAATLRPIEVDRMFWKRVFVGALDDLAELIAPSQIIFCEGRPETNGNRRATTFDADVYRRLFRKTHPSTEFIPMGGANDVEKNSALVVDVFGRLFTTMAYWRLLDRDDRSDLGIEELRREGTRVLRRRDLESYLWDDEVLSKLCQSTSNPSLTDYILSYKRCLLENGGEQGRAVDDVKSVSGQLYVEVKKKLGLIQCGNTAAEFCKSTLVPLISPDMGVYKELEADVFG